MSKALYSTVVVGCLMLATGSARAATQPSLDEVLAQTFQPARASAVRAEEGTTCRTLSDMGRRGRRERVCMSPANWRALVAAAVLTKVAQAQRGYGH